MINQQKQTIFEKKNVLVIGGAGFIGSHLCDELVKTAKVICLDNFSTGEEKNIDHLLSDPNFKFINHDISLPIELETLPELQLFKINFQGIQEIYNLACPHSPRNFNQNKINNALANSLGVKNSLDLAIKYQAKYLHFSSAVVYGPRIDDNKKIDEEFRGLVDFTSQRSSYDEGKRFAETMVINYGEVYGLETKIMRLFRTYGPRMKLDDDQMIPDFIKNALDNTDLIINGDENFSSSFCYVSDVIDAAVKMMEKDRSLILNIGSDNLVNVTELAQLIIDAVGSKSKIVYEKEHFFLTPLPLPNISKSLDEVGWIPIITLEKGVERTIYDLRASKGLKGVKSILN
ncbi:MAG: NAD-dependent epimerase/dehydratase family protein [Parcubacteria group bacterium GW2011_GWE2_39_37]|uniref:NAD-dependent epimerase/dehydratase family protein n=1 Tax=Candidatus Falkowbacteria bacterium GW2011_GWF2_39_8 TaxID=1618642 RepID=A0A0G0PTR2_9BACT|nr:MAG: NAD-dependent epimerase/dehydratase family protein [Parcubacteria group bacterium GW2011_GWE2_39_37]KKR31288.1 MAG: NAD-dependent epimerase/dehydratase family protein [Candidatus Falkowbacteria bacterium GW2011_GWF2_39_8]